MYRFILAFCTVFGAWPALAQDVVLRPILTEAQVYLSGADLTYRAEADLPQGSARVWLIAQGLGEGAALAVTDGATIRALRLLPDQAIDPVAFDTEAQAEARRRLIAAQEARAQAEAAFQAAAAEVAAIGLQLAHLDAVAGAGAAGIDGITARLDALAQARRSLIAQEDASRAALAQAQTRLDAALRAQDLAQAALDRSLPLPDTAPILEVDLEVTGDAPVTLTLSERRDDISWRPDYRLALDTNAARLRIERIAHLTTSGTIPWSGVAVAFSTADPNAPTAPVPLMPDPARIGADVPIMPMARSAEMAAVMGADMGVAVTLQTQGMAQRFVYPDPVDIDASGRARLIFAPLEAEVSLTQLALPRLHDRAYLMVDFTNDSGAPILAAPATLYRDGAYIGRMDLPTIPAGARAQMGFGAIDHLILSWREVQRDEGARGLFDQDGSQRREIVFGVENLSDRPEEVTLRYATPFAEQEALRLDVTLTPAPDARDIEGLRGVAEWRLPLDAGARQDITMVVELRYPQDQMLFWQP